VIKRLKPYAFATLLADATIGILVLTRHYFDDTTAALVMVLAIMAIALLWKSGPALWASVICTLCYNYYFIVPYGTLNIEAREDVVAFIAFTAISIIMGQLSARVEARAIQAEARRIEIEMLYDKLRLATEEAAEAELLRRSEKLKSALLDAVTHDLRTPLTSIKAAVTTILSELPKEDDYQRELLQVIDEESDRLNRFIEEMMDLARLENGGLDIRRSETTVSEIVETALDRAAPLLVNHQVEVNIDPLLPTMAVDAVAFSQVLYSLLDNASKYSQPGSLISVSARLQDSLLIVSVRDAGSGIPKELRERVFDKFFRGNLGGTKRAGFGLGLSIAKGIVEAHSGRIWIEDAAGGGTSVLVSIPIGSARVRTA
jgi:K+-sensing histidine kinase KdpD